MTNLKDYLTDMVKETIILHSEFVSECPNATKEEYEIFVEDIVDGYLLKIKARLIGE